MAEATLSSKNQIVLPKQARAALGAKPGDRLLVTVYDRSVVVIEKPKAHHLAIRGLAKGGYPRGYLQKERQSWD